MFVGRAVDAGGGELSGVHAGEHGDGQQLRRIEQPFERVPGSREHRRPARRVDGEFVDAEGRGRAHRACDGVGDVVKLEVEKHRVAPLEQRLDHRRPGGSEQFQPHLEPLAGIFEARGQSNG